VIDAHERGVLDRPDALLIAVIGMGGGLGRAPLSVEGGRVTLRLRRGREALSGDRLLNRVRGLGRVVGLDGRVEIG